MTAVNGPEDGENFRDEDNKSIHRPGLWVACDGQVLYREQDWVFVLEWLHGGGEIGVMDREGLERGLPSEQVDKFGQAQRGIEQGDIRQRRGRVTWALAISRRRKAE